MNSREMRAIWKNAKHTLEVITGPRTLPMTTDQRDLLQNFYGFYTILSAVPLKQREEIPRVFLKEWTWYLKTKALQGRHPYADAITTHYEELSNDPYPAKLRTLGRTSSK